MDFLSELKAELERAGVEVHGPYTLVDMQLSVNNNDLVKIFYSGGTVAVTNTKSFPYRSLEEMEEDKFVATTGTRVVVPIRRHTQNCLDSAVKHILETRDALRSWVNDPYSIISFNVYLVNLSKIDNVEEWGYGQFLLLKERTLWKSTE